MREIIIDFCQNMYVNADPRWVDGWRTVSGSMRERLGSAPGPWVNHAGSPGRECRHDLFTQLQTVRAGMHVFIQKGRHLGLLTSRGFPALVPWRLQV